MQVRFSFRALSATAPAEYYVVEFFKFISKAQSISDEEVSPRYCYGVIRLTRFLLMSPIGEHPFIAKQGHFHTDNRECY